MPRFTRRQWLAAVPISSLTALTPLAAPAQVQLSGAAKKTGLDLGDFEPRSMLHVPEHAVERARFPVIDIHTHLAFSLKSEKGVAMGEERKFLASAEELLEVMDRKNIRTMVNLTGGTGAGLAKSLKRYDEAVKHFELAAALAPKDRQIPVLLKRAKDAASQPKK